MTLFSVVMPAYNAEHTIRLAIQSVLDQSFPDWELIVVDDGSSDATSVISGRFASQDPRVIAHSLPFNSGVAAARNHALSNTRGRYIAFLDADDTWEPNKLALQLSMFKLGHLVVFGAYERKLPSGRKQTIAASFRVTKEDFFKCNPIGNLTGAYDRSLGVFLQKQIRHEDYLMWYEIVCQAQYAVGIAQSIAVYNVAPSSLSGSKLRSAYWHWRILRSEFALTPFKASRYFLSYLIRSLMIRIS